MAAPRQKVVLAYSGGLDTSVLVRILTDEYGYDVIACHADVGESRDHEKLKAKAKQAGAIACEIVDAKEEFARDMTRLSSADGFLEKPFTVESLTGIVERALDAR